MKNWMVLLGSWALAASFMAGCADDEITDPEPSGAQSDEGEDDGQEHGSGGNTPGTGGSDPSAAGGSDPSAAGGSDPSGAGGSSQGGGDVGCEDTGPLPATIMQPHHLPDIDDDDASGDSVSGILVDGDDKDYYFYNGEDKAGSAVNPTVELAVTPANASTLVCMYFDCVVDGDTDVTCNDDSIDSNHPITNNPGCCTTTDNGGTATLKPSLICGDNGPAGLESAKVDIAVVDSGAACDAYQLDYHF